MVNISDVFCSCFTRVWVCLFLQINTDHFNTSTWVQFRLRFDWNSDEIRRKVCGPPWTSGAAGFISQSPSIKTVANVVMTSRLNDVDFPGWHDWNLLKHSLLFLRRMNSFLTGCWFPTESGSSGRRRTAGRHVSGDALLRVYYSSLQLRGNQKHQNQNVFLTVSFCSRQMSLNSNMIRFSLSRSGRTVTFNAESKRQLKLHTEKMTSNKDTADMLFY